MLRFLFVGPTDLLERRNQNLLEFLYCRFCNLRELLLNISDDCYEMVEVAHTVSLQLVGPTVAP